jgi:hypothetical protein
MGVEHSREGVKHPPGHVKTLLETPETQMCGLPSPVRIRMVLMATDMASSRVRWQLIGRGWSGGALSPPSSRGNR